MKKNSNCLRDLKDCYKRLDKIIPASKRKEMAKEENMVHHHFGLGTWLRNNLGLWEDSKLSRYFNSLGITHPDDMTGIILSGYHCYLKKINYDLQADIKHYQQYWKDLQSKTNKD